MNGASGDFCENNKIYFVLDVERPGKGLLERTLLIRVGG